MHERWRDAFLGWWGRAVVTHRWIVCILALLLTVASLWITATRLTMQSDRSLLVDRTLSWNAAYLRYKQAFERWGDILVVIDRGSTDAQQFPGRAEQMADALIDQLNAEPIVAGCLSRYESQPRQARLILSHAPADFDRQWAQVEASRPVLDSPSVVDFIRHALTGLLNASNGADQQQPGPGAIASGLDQLSTMLERIQNVAMLSGDSIVAPHGSTQRHLETESGRYVLISVALAHDGDGSVSGVREGIATVRRHLRQLQSTRLFAGIDAGVTGIPVLENDETAQSMRDSTWTSVLAFVLIAVLMLAVFRGWYVPAAIGLALVIGIIWSFGFATLAVGHLQVLSVVFTAILLGLGVDFGLHLVARLELARDMHEGLGDVLSRVMRAIGPGMITGAVTTSASFAVMMLTSFRGVAEMGLIAAGGILLCMVSMLALFPVLLTLRGHWRKVVRIRRGGENAHFAHGRLDFVDQNPWKMIAGAIVVVIIGALSATRTRYDPNLMHLHPPGVESVTWEQRLIDDSGHSSWIGLSVADSLQQAQARTRAFLSHAQQVGSVGGIGELFHPRRIERSAMIAARMPSRIPPTLEADKDQLRALLDQVIAGLKAFPDAGDRQTKEARERLQQNCQVLSDLLQSEQSNRIWSRITNAYAQDRQRLIETWRQLADPREPSLDDLPQPVRALNTSADGRLLLRIYPTGIDDESVLSPDRLGPFVATMRQVDQGVIGPAVQVYESTRLISRAYAKATLLALLVIMLMLIVDFHSLPDACSAILPVALGFILMFGVMGATGLALNFANIIVMPVIFGIGVDAGVHIVHRWREDPSGIPRGLSGATGRGILLTMLTTMIGFGCLALAQHRGIRGLGITMVIGLALTLGACYLVLPAVLRLRTDRAARR